MGNKQTAVEFAVDKLEKFIPGGNQIAIFAILEQAKQMEKDQIMEACGVGFNDGQSYMDGNPKFQSAEQYYNETYGK